VYRLPRPQAQKWAFEHLGSTLPPLSGANFI